MTTTHRTTQILRMLADVEHATSNMISAHIECARSEVLKTLRNMRAREVITTDDKKHRITDKGRNELLIGARTKIVRNARQQSEYLLAKPSDISVSQENSVMRRPTWAPEPWVPARPGADDHKQFASRGIV